MMQNKPKHLYAFKVDMGLLVPYIYIPEYGFGCSNAYVSVGFDEQYLKKVDSSYGCSNVEMSGTYSVWQSHDARLDLRAPLITYPVSKVVPVQYASAFNVLYQRLVELYPNSSNVLP